MNGLKTRAAGQGTAELRLTEECIASFLEELARKGHTVWMINLVCTVITVACDLLAFLPVINLLTLPIMLVTLIAALIGSVMYILFIYRASKALA